MSAPRVVVARAASMGNRATADYLAMLTTYDLDDSRELPDLLERAQAVTERIDISRSHAVDEKIPLHPGELHGTE